MSGARRLLNDAEEKMLTRNNLGRICTIDGYGFPHCVRVDYVYHNGTILVGSLVPRKWHSHLATNPKVAFEIDMYEEKRGVFDFRGLMIKGRALLVEDNKERKEAVALLRTRHPRAPYGENPVIVRIVPMKRLRWGPWEDIREDR